MFFTYGAIRVVITLIIMPVVKVGIVEITQTIMDTVHILLKLT